MYAFPSLDPVSCLMSSSNCCFLTLIQISQETVKMVWYSHLFKSFLQFIMIHTVKGFSVVDETEVDIFLEFPCFLYDPASVGNLISDSSSFSKPSLDIWKFLVHIMLKSSMQDFMHDLTSMGWLPWWLSGKESTCQCRRLGFDPWVRRSCGEGNGNTLQHSCLGKSWTVEPGRL